MIGISQINSQEHTVGVTAGYTNFNFSVNDDSVESASGLYIGVFKDFTLNEVLLIRPELQFAHYKRTDWDNPEPGEFSDIVLPILLQYNFWNSLSVIGGPQFDYVLDDDSFGYNNFGFSVAFGLHYDISPNFLVNWRMSYGLSERFEINDFEIVNEVVDARTHTFNLGLGYKF